MKINKTLLPILILITSCTSKQDVDTIINASIIYCCDSTFEQAQSVAIKDGKIVAIGTSEDIQNTYRAKEIIKAEDKVVFPGFIDAHCHFSGYALDGYKCDLVGTKSFSEVLYKVAEYQKSNKLSWIYGRGWDQNDWETKEFPDKSLLDKLYPDIPVILKRIDGHSILCNQKALDMAGIDNRTKIPGGIIEKKNNQLTGILIDNATEPVERLIPALPENEAIKYFQQTEKECFSYGLTGVVDCGVKDNVIELLLKLYNDSKLKIGNSILLSQNQETLDSLASKRRYKNGQVQITGIKVYADGALGSRGACLLEEYADKKNYYGLILTDMNKIRAFARLAKAHNFQLCTHAIGDSANRAILRLYTEFLDKNNDKRWRIEHAQVVDYQDYKLYSAYNIIPSVQPTHAISDMPWAEQRLGPERIHTAYAYKNLMQLNGWIPLGTDFPVEGIDPLATFYTAVIRKDKNGYPENGFMKENALTREEALKGMTIWAAKSVFLENKKGSIEKGKDADLVILDKDIMTCDEKDILNTSVMYTIVKGEIVYTKKGAE